jgi:hypothetical protein
MRDWGSAMKVYDNIPDRNNRRAVAVLRLNMTHIFQSPLYQKIEETDVVVCNHCQEIIEIDVWPHLFVECDAVRRIREEYRQAPLFSSVSDFHNALFRPAGQLDLHFRVIGGQIRRVMHSLGGDTQ